MKEVLEKLSAQHLFSSFLPLSPSLLKTRRKMVLYKGVDTKQYYHIVFSVAQKSRFGVKHAEEMISYEKSLVAVMEHQFKYKHLLIDAPLCSKARTVLNMDGWNIV